MKKKELKELKEKSVKDLLDLVKKKKIEALNATARIYAGKEKNLKKAKNLRKEIAKILTIINIKKKEQDKK
jgi:ribosomal protein L29